MVAFLALAGAGCSVARAPAAPPPQIPTIVAPTSYTRPPMMVDRPLPDDCEAVVPAEQMNTALGQKLPGEPKLIVGVPEASVGRTNKIDCYYGIPDGKPLGAAVVVVGLAAYVDEATAKNRITESVDAERQDSATVSEVDVGKQKGTLVATKDERLLIGSLGKTTFVVRAKNGVLPDDKLGPVLASLAFQSMTAPTP
jgi:hypothetical protein